MKTEGWGENFLIILSQHYSINHNEVFFNENQSKIVLQYAPRES